MNKTTLTSKFTPFFPFPIPLIIYSIFLIFHNIKYIQQKLSIINSVNVFLMLCMHIIVLFILCKKNTVHNDFKFF